jgi:hypothetical protein
MRIKRGWSTDFGKTRFDVEIDEDDLLRMLVEQGAEDPAAVRAAMRSMDAFRVMDAEAAAYEHMAVLSRTPEGSEEAAALTLKFRAHRGERNRLIAKYLPPPAGDEAAAPPAAP